MEVYIKYTLGSQMRERLKELPATKTKRVVPIEYELQYWVLAEAVTSEDDTKYEGLSFRRWGEVDLKAVEGMKADAKKKVLDRVKQGESERRKARRIKEILKGEVVSITE